MSHPVPQYLFPFYYDPNKFRGNEAHHRLPKDQKMGLQCLYLKEDAFIGDTQGEITVLV